MPKPLVTIIIVVLIIAAVLFILNLEFGGGVEYINNLQPAGQ